MPKPKPVELLIRLPRRDRVFLNDFAASRGLSLSKVIWYLVAALRASVTVKPNAIQKGEPKHGN